VHWQQLVVFAQQRLSELTIDSFAVDDSRHSNPMDDIKESLSATTISDLNLVDGLHSTTIGTLCTEVPSDLTMSLERHNLDGSLIENCVIVPISQVLPNVAFPQSSYLPVEYLQLCLVDSIYEETINHIVSLLSVFPRNQHTQRVSFLRKHFSASSNSWMVDIGLQAVDMALFDDDIKLCVVGESIVAKDAVRICTFMSCDRFALVGFLLVGFLW
jgi:hypothetical protein